MKKAVRNYSKIFRIHFFYKRNTVVEHLTNLDANTIHIVRTKKNSMVSKKKVPEWIKLT